MQMTNEQTIAVFKNMIRSNNEHGNTLLCIGEVQALDMAIKALNFVSEYHQSNIEAYAHDMGVSLEQAERELRMDRTTGDLISRQDVIDALAKGQAYYSPEDGAEIFYEYNHAIKALKNLPSAQTAIVRCKDCRHSVDYYHEGDCYCSNPKWGLMYFGGSWEFYCADAERRSR